MSFRKRQGAGQVRTRLAIRIHSALEHWFPERRVFLKSDSDTRFIRLRPGTQLLTFAGCSVLVGWSIVATSILLMDSIGADNLREQARRDQDSYKARLDSLSAQRDGRAAEARAAQERFNAALAQISQMQSDLLASETRRRELETGIEVIQATLRDTMRERDGARTALAQVEGVSEDADGNIAIASAETPVPVDFLSEALARTAAERDEMRLSAEDAISAADELAYQIDLMKDQNDVIFRQLEEAMTVSVTPLDKMFKSAGMNPDKVLDQVRRGYSGQGGPLTPITFTTRGEEPSPDAQRANALLGQMDRLNLYRIAAERAPFAQPVKSAFRFTSGFGSRRDPITGGRRMHEGLDFAGKYGTPLYATADGTVVKAGWHSGYGRMVQIRHDFGIETLYGHMSKLHVKVGERVSRGDRIGDMGSSGRSTGTHLHYEVHVNGRPVNPMTYIKAARDVF